MNNLMQVFGLNQSGQGFYTLGKNCVEAFGMTRACFISILADIDSYSKSQGNERFFATLETLMQKTRLSDKTIKKFMRELKDYKILDEGIKGEGDDNKKYYIFDYEMLGKIIAERVGNSTPKVEGKNTLNIKGNSTPKVEGKNTPQIITNKIKTDSIITNSAERILPKKIDSNLTFDYLAYAKEKFENANDKPKVSLDLWLEFIKSKKLVLKKYRRKNITAKMIDLNFAELYKLSEIGVNLNERLNKAIADEWQGIWFASDSKEWQKRGGHFRNNVGHLDYDQSKNVDNPLRAIETHIKL